MKRKSRLVEADLRALGDNLRRWRILQEMTAENVAERASITRSTLAAIETGAGTAQLTNVLSVMRVLGIQDLVVAATEPLNTEIGRQNADRILPKRVRTRAAPRPPVKAVT